MSSKLAGVGQIGHFWLCRNGHLVRRLRVHSREATRACVSESHRKKSQDPERMIPCMHELVVCYQYNCRRTILPRHERDLTDEIFIGGTNRKRMNGGFFVFGDSNGGNKERRCFFKSRVMIARTNLKLCPGERQLVVVQFLFS